MGRGRHAAGLPAGQIAFIRDNVDIIFLLIVAVSVLPIAWEVGKRMLSSRRTPLGEAVDAFDGQLDGKVEPSKWSSTETTRPQSQSPARPDGAS